VFRLKGGGWYETDFKGEKDKKRNLADRAEAEPSKDAKSQAPETKTESAVASAEPDKVAQTKPAEKSIDRVSNAPSAARKKKSSIRHPIRRKASKARK
jgi:hypothetical protein